MRARPLACAPHLRSPARQMEGVAPQYGKKGKVKDDDGELKRNKSIKGGKSGGMMSFRRGGKKKDTDTHGDEDDGDERRLRRRVV